MTLAQAVEKLQSRFRVYAHADFDADNPNLCSAAINLAAGEVARECLSLWTPYSALTLTAGTTMYDFTDSTVCAGRVFAPYGVYINGNWLLEMEPNDFQSAHPTIWTESQTAKPADYCRHSERQTEIAGPPSSTAVAATNYVMGFRYPSALDWPGSQDTELEGPQTYHDLIVDRAYLTNSLSYGISDEALQMRALIERTYEQRRKRHSAENASRYRKARRTGAHMGTTRRMVRVGDLF